MIDEKFLKELELSEEVIEKILERVKEDEAKGNYEKLLKEEIEKLKPYDAELVIQLFDGEGEAAPEALREKLLAFKEKYPFLFEKGEVPQLAGSTKAAKGVTAEEFKAMSYNKRIELYKKNPKLYKQLMNA